MAIPTAHSNFVPGQVLAAGDLNVRFNELQDLLTGGLTDDNVGGISPTIVTDTAMTLSGGAEQVCSQDTKFSASVIFSGSLILEVNTFASADATPDVSGGTLFHTNSTTVTNFDNGVAGQWIIVHLVDGVSVIQHGGAGLIFTVGGLDIINNAPGAGQRRSRFAGFIYDGTSWYQTFESGNV